MVSVIYAQPVYFLKNEAAIDIQCYICQHIQRDISIYIYTLYIIYYIVYIYIYIYIYISADPPTPADARGSAPGKKALSQLPFEIDGRSSSFTPMVFPAGPCGCVFVPLQWQQQQQQQQPIFCKFSVLFLGFQT